MTNAEIIFRNMQELIENGVLTDKDTIHTFQGWKTIGFSVKKGEHSFISFPIWKKGKPKKDEDGNIIKEGKMFMVNSHFFTQKQVGEMQ